MLLQRMQLQSVKKRSVQQIMEPMSQVIPPGKSVTLLNGTTVSVLREISSHEEHVKSIPNVLKEGDTNAHPNGNKITYEKQNSKRKIKQEFSHEIREGEMVALPDGANISVQKRDAYRNIQPLYKPNQAGETLTLSAQNFQPFSFAINAGEEFTLVNGTTISAIKEHNQPLCCPIHSGETKSIRKNNKTLNHDEMAYSQPIHVGETVTLPGGTMVSVEKPNA